MTTYVSAFGIKALPEIQNAHKTERITMTPRDIYEAYLRGAVVIVDGIRKHLRDFPMPDVKYVLKGIEEYRDEYGDRAVNMLLSTS